MNKIHLIDQNNNICIALLPALLEVSSDHEVALNSTQPNGEQVIRNRIHFKLYNTEDGKVLFYEQSQQKGVSVTTHDSLEQIAFPLTLFKQQDFISFLKSHKLDQNRQSFVLQKNPAAPLFLVHSDHKTFIMSDAEIIGYRYIKQADGNSTFVFLADYGDEIGMVTDFGAEESLQLDKSLISKKKIDAKFLEHHIYGIDKLCLAVLATKGCYPQVESKQPQTNHRTVECYIELDHLKKTQPQVISLQKSDSSFVDIRIFGEVFAEYTFNAAELPKSNAKGTHPPHDYKILCFSANNDVGVGLIVFKILEDGSLNYHYTYIVRERLGESVYQWSSEVNGNYMINEVIERILTSNGVAEPKRYIGLIKNEQVNPAQAMSISDKVTYAEQKSLITIGRRKTVIIVEQYGTLVAYDVSAHTNQLISIMPDNELLQVINQLSVQGSEYTAKVVGMMELLIKHGKLNQKKPCNF